jgi:hypothetical protein
LRGAPRRPPIPCAPRQEVRRQWGRDGWQERRGAALLPSRHRAYQRALEGQPTFRGGPRWVTVFFVASVFRCGRQPASRSCGQRRAHRRASGRAPPERGCRADGARLATRSPPCTGGVPRRVRDVPRLGRRCVFPSRPSHGRSRVRNRLSKPLSHARIRDERPVVVGAGGLLRVVAGDRDAVRARCCARHVRIRGRNRERRTR